MHALGVQRTQGIIHKAMPRQPRQPGEAGAGDAHGEVTARARPGVAGVQVAVVLHDQDFGLQGGAQPLLDLRAAKPAGDGGQGFFGSKSIAAELMQKRSPVGSGPSGNTWPRWLPHLLQRTSTRTMPWLTSRTRSTTSLFTAS